MVKGERLHTNEENDISEDANFCKFLENPNYSEEDNKTWEIQVVSVNTLMVEAIHFKEWHNYEKTCQVMQVLTNAKSSKGPLFKSWDKASKIMNILNIWNLDFSLLSW